MKIDNYNLIKAAEYGTIKVRFKSYYSDTEYEVPYTLNEDIAGHNMIKQKSDNDYIVLWDLNRNGWESIKADTIISWELL